MFTSTTPDLESLRGGCVRCSLREFCLPAGTVANDIARLKDIVCWHRPVEQGGRLFREGAALTSVFVARIGAFKTITVSEDGEEQILGFHLPGDLIGLDSFGTGAHRSEAIALTSSVVCEMPFDELSNIATRIPGSQKHLAREIGRCADRDNYHMKILFRRQASERIAMFLHSWSGRLHRVGLPAFAFKLPMSREDIARYLGLALETVSRGFSRLKDDGVITVYARHVQIVDPEALARLMLPVETTATVVIASPVSLRGAA